MKSIISMVLLLLSLTVGAQTSPTGVVVNSTLSAVSIVLNIGGWIFKDSKKVYYVQVESTGLTEDAARASAYSKAVELAVGAVVFTGRETTNDQQNRNEIIVHSGGYVEDYKIISNTKVNGMTKLVVDVWVSDAKIAQRLFAYGRNEGATINGEQIQSNWDRDQAIKQTEERRQKTGRELVMSVLKDLPKMGYTSKVVANNVSYHNGSLSMGITVVTSYNPEYISDLAKVMKETTGEYSRLTGVRRGVMIDHAGFGSGWTRTNTYFDNYTQAFESPMYMIIKFYGNNGNLNFTNCWKFIDKDENNYRVLSGYRPDTHPSNRGMGFHDPNFYVITEGGKLTITYIQPRGSLTEEQFIRWASNIERVEAKLVDGSDSDSNRCRK